MEKLAYYPTTIKVNPINTESQTIKTFCNEQYSNKGNNRSRYAKYVFKR